MANFTRSLNSTTESLAGRSTAHVSMNTSPKVPGLAGTGVARELGSELQTPLISSPDPLRNRTTQPPRRSTQRRETIGQPWGQIYTKLLTITLFQPFDRRGRRRVRNSNIANGIAGAWPRNRWWLAALKTEYPRPEINKRVLSPFRPPLFVPFSATLFRLLHFV